MNYAGPTATSFENILILRLNLKGFQHDKKADHSSVYAINMYNRDQLFTLA